MKVLKKYSWKKFLLWILTPLVLGFGLVFGFWQKFMDSRTKRAVEKAQDKQETQSREDAADVADIVARQEGKTEAVIETITTIKETTEPGSDERLEAITNEVAEMSARRREEAKRRAGRS